MEKFVIDIDRAPRAPEGYNRGEKVEWYVGYALTGVPGRRNNRRAEVGGDVEGWQVKSPKASLTENDNCGGYIFGFEDGVAYKMSRAEFESFAAEWCFIDRDSYTNRIKRRIKNDSKKMREWLNARA